MIARIIAKIKLLENRFNDLSGQKTGYLIVAMSGSFLGICLITYLGFRFETALIFPPLASSTVVLFESPVSLSKVKCVVGGQLISAIVGVTVSRFLGVTWWSIAIAVTLAFYLMILTDTLHPPGGSTAFVAVLSNHSYGFVIMPVLLGVGLLILVALVIHVILINIRRN
ncbi:HPP family protein [Thermosediminibacter oceani]|uniref:HPP family protein n=1 Tax=Thermosediminibacter oceani (strain ATCC BAA-1034 / DSM 16646 / JW/IW-1228P) TaxID=555079 RepID=D9RY57_THEOJ|nr:HPP family protein [Thermosediminibacter oceani]ADL08281.1 HPP family protein [Thermosediminibacter oceani DSM 16646]